MYVIWNVNVKDETWDDIEKNETWDVIEKNETWNVHAVLHVAGDVLRPSSRLFLADVLFQLQVPLPLLPQARVSDKCLSQDQLLLLLLPVNPIAMRLQIVGGHLGFASLYRNLLTFRGALLPVA